MNNKGPSKWALYYSRKSAKIPHKGLPRATPLEIYAQVLAWFA
ncbi:hypothetical protein SAMN04515695_0857 [Pseudovibrio sp. Tun.PSC04-5.I4]|nr:hypothetical protein SAMN04515695_0857 [Pseudovibrio sp. Tun.PSC04-5.I4]